MNVSPPLATLEQRGSVAILRLDRPPVNALSAQLRAALAARLEDAFARPDVFAVVLTGAGEHFSAGADIREFGRPVDPTGPSLVDVIKRIDEASKPVVAAVHGATAGGALELALACAYRIGALDTQISLPEVTLGFVPGAGGTVRLPRLVGVEKALDLILSGRRIGAEEASSWGLLDGSAPLMDLLASAVALAERASVLPKRRIRDLPVRQVPADVFTGVEEELSKRGRGGQAPAAALACVRRAVELPFDDALTKERHTFLSMVQTPESVALRHVFFAEREAQKVAQRASSISGGSVCTVGIVGFGTMGAGIATACAAAGFTVVVVDETQDAVDRGLVAVKTTFERARARGRISDAECAVRIGRINAHLDYEALSGADLVIEAAFEEMDVKQTVFARLARVCGESTILATNTSSLDVNVIARGTHNPARVLGLHFFSPANIMTLVEVIRPDAVSPNVLATALAFVKQLGKVGVVVGVGEGFVGNRMLFVYRRQAEFLLEEGALPHEVDDALRAFGMAMGPFQTGDVAGLDISWRIRRRLKPTRPPTLRYSPIADRLCEMGRFGQKTGAGWYRYEKGSRTAIPDPQVDALVRAVSVELGFTPRTITSAEIVERCLAALVNEGAAILEEGLAARPGDIDVIWIHGYGFPRHRGGPMHWANTIGLSSILDIVDRLHADQGALVQPSVLLRQLVRDGRDFDISGARLSQVQQP